jgi:hypothetical protein
MSTGQIQPVKDQETIVIGANVRKKELEQLRVLASEEDRSVSALVRRGIRMVLEASGLEQADHKSNPPGNDAAAVEGGR